MCCETVIYVAEYFLILALAVTKTIFKKIPLKGGFQKCLLLPT